MIIRTALFFAVMTFLNCNNQNLNGTSGDLPDTEKTNISNNENVEYKTNYIEVVQMSLKRAIVEKQIQDYNLIKDKKNIILADTLVNQKILPQFDSTSITIMNSDNLRAYANKNGDFVCLRFTMIEEVNDSTYNVLLETNWVASETSEVAYLSGGGDKIEYSKVNGIWTTRIYGGVIY